MIKKCTCHNDFQDKTYGKGMRVMNKTAKKRGTDVVYRCTSCKAERT